MGREDQMEIIIEEDGQITVLTDQVSMPNHKAADDFLAFVAKQAGGPVTRTKRKQGHSHAKTGQHLRHGHRH
jgi:hypothetical protein